MARRSVALWKAPHSHLSSVVVTAAALSPMDDRLPHTCTHCTLATEGHAGVEMALLSVPLLIQPLERPRHPSELMSDGTAPTKPPLFSPGLGSVPLLRRGEAHACRKHSACGVRIGFSASVSPMLSSSPDSSTEVGAQQIKQGLKSN